MGMYESPIKIIEQTLDSFYKDIVKKKDDAIFAEIQSSFGVDLDKYELIRALQYDRNQYEKGYADGKRDAMAELVRCKGCKHLEISGCYGECGRAYLGIVKPWDFCSRGERREGE